MSNLRSRLLLLSTALAVACGPPPGEPDAGTKRDAGATDAGAAGAGGAGGGGEAGAGGGDAGGGGTGGGGGAGGSGGTAGGGGGSAGSGGGTGATGGSSPTLRGTLVVSRIGPAADGGPLSNAAASVALEVRPLPTGLVTQSYLLPTAAGGGNQAFTNSGTATSDGILQRSVDGRFFLLAGYSARPGTAAVVADPSPRVIARVTVDGGVADTSTTLEAYTSNNMRAVASVDGTAYWTAGTGPTDAGIAGVRYVTHGATDASVELFAALPNTRGVGIFGGQLYASTGTAIPGAAAAAGVTTQLFSVGVGLPTAPTTAQGLPGMPDAGALLSNFALFDRVASEPGVDLAYVADQTQGVGIRKFVRMAGQWQEQVRFNRGLALDGGTDGGCLHLAAAEMGSDVVLACSTNDPAPNRVVGWVDLGGQALSSPQGVTVCEAANGTVFRGVLLLAP